MPFFPVFTSSRDDFLMFRLLLRMSMYLEACTCKNINKINDFERILSLHATMPNAAPTLAQGATTAAG
jgi:hypothetical protein